MSAAAKFSWPWLRHAVVVGVFFIVFLLFSSVCLRHWGDMQRVLNTGDTYINVLCWRLSEQSWVTEALFVLFLTCCQSCGRLDSTESHWTLLVSPSDSFSSILRTVWLSVMLAAARAKLCRNSPPLPGCTLPCWSGYIHTEVHNHHHHRHYHRHHMWMTWPTYSNNACVVHPGCISSPGSIIVSQQAEADRISFERKQKLENVAWKQ